MCICHGRNCSFRRNFYYYSSHFLHVTCCSHFHSWCWSSCLTCQSHRIYSICIFFGVICIICPNSCTLAIWSRNIYHSVILDITSVSYIDSFCWCKSACRCLDSSPVFSDCTSVNVHSNSFTSHKVDVSIVNCLRSWTYCIHTYRVRFAHFNSSLIYNSSLIRNLSVCWWQWVVIIISCCHTYTVFFSVSIRISNFYYSSSKVCRSSAGSCIHSYTSNTIWKVNYSIIVYASISVKAVISISCRCQWSVINHSSLIIILININCICSQSYWICCIRCYSISCSKIYNSKWIISNCHARSCICINVLISSNCINTYSLIFSYCNLRICIQVYCTVSLSIDCNSIIPSLNASCIVVNIISINSYCIISNSNFTIISYRIFSFRINTDICIFL